MTTIYALVDPRDGEVRYVGKTQAPAHRLIRHLWDARNGLDQTHRSRWIRQLLALGLAPEMRAIELVESSAAAAVERSWIASFRASGSRLTNLTDGGEGAPGRKWTVTSRAKIVAARTGKRHTPETRARISQSKRGRPLSATHRARIAAALHGRSWSSSFKPGHQMSTAVRAKIGATARLAPNKGTFTFGHRESQESRDKRSRTLSGRHLPLLHRRRIAEAQRRRLASLGARRLSLEHRDAIRRGVLASRAARVIA